MKNKKIFLKIIGCLYIFFSINCIFALPVSAAQAVENFGFLMTTESGDYSYKITWWQPQYLRENQYYILFPYEARGKALEVEIKSNVDEIYLNGEVIADGDIIPPLPEGENWLFGPGYEYKITALYSSNIPAIHISTESENISVVYEDKNHKEPAYAVILENNEIAYEGQLEYIKGRGNITWLHEKKPFNIKFSEKIDLFGMGKAKKWVLFANWYDFTSIKNKLASDWARKIGVPFCSESLLVDLYIDDTYIGNYTLMEPVEVGENRIDIMDLDEINKRANEGVILDELPFGGTRGQDSYANTGSYKWVELLNDPGVFSGGYVLEYELADRYDDEPCGFVSEYGQPIVLKFPEYASKEQVVYIRDYYNEFEEAVLSENGHNVLGKHYSEYIDVESAANMYIIQEYAKNLDAGLTSFFIYKDVEQKFVFAPVWDFDQAFGAIKERNGVSVSDPHGEWVLNGKLIGSLEGKETILSLLCEHEDFLAMIKNQWEEKFLPEIYWMIPYAETIFEENRNSILADKIKWKTDKEYEDAMAYVDDGINALTDFLTKRGVFLTQMFASWEVEAQNMEVKNTQKDVNFVEEIKISLKIFWHDFINEWKW